MNDHGATRYHDAPDTWRNWRGRIGRKRYWLAYQLPLMAALAAGVVIIAAVGDGAVIPLAVLGGPLWVWFSLASTVKRLHDHNLSGWAYLGFIIVGVIADLVHPVLGGALNLGVAVFLGLVRGTRGANEYGPDPVDPTAPAEYAPSGFLRPDGGVLGR